LKTLLLAYYHPVVFDLALSFKKIFHDVHVCATNDLKDNYGGVSEVQARCKRLGLHFMPLMAAAMGIKSKKYDLVGVDGVFHGDSVLMDSCEGGKVPFFCINGYPHNRDEPSKNILSLSWFLPQFQYRQSYPHEVHVKELNWKRIAENGKDDKQKNVFVFYPEFSQLKNNIGLPQRPALPTKLVSFIHRFEECNENSFKVFERVSETVGGIENYTSLSQIEVWKKLREAKALVHLKHGDCPGIAVLEAMLLGTPPVVMKDFVLASNNQEVLIDGQSAMVCDSVEEMIERINSTEANHLSLRSSLHAKMITDFPRQQRKLKSFFERCISEA
jgi:glycosyltransferase involved in cell wall biosynthesis